VDERAGTILCRLYPLDRAKNADGQRRSLEPLVTLPVATEPAPAVPPLLDKLLAEYAATGLPPAYLPQVNEEEMLYRSALFAGLRPGLGTEIERRHEEAASGVTPEAALSLCPRWLEGEGSLADLAGGA
jgi:hypothetical protein